MDKLIEVPFNPKPSTIMHIDINSCFATIEQQANPQLRGKPIAVAAYTGPSGCIIAPSVQAKILGIKTGTKVKEGLRICPNLVILPPDPQKYRHAHLKLREVLETYTNDVFPKSIDEFVMNLEGAPALKKGMWKIAKEIKKLIKERVGDYITVSIGIAPNRFLAKIASNLQKPNGLIEINKHNHIQIFKQMELMDLWGIKKGNSTRLANKKIFTALDFFNATPRNLKDAFRSICGYHWYLRLRGWEIDDVIFERKSFGNSYALPKPFVKPEELAPILCKLTEKTGFRLRKNGYKARGVHLAISYRDGTYWHKAKMLPNEIFDSRDLYKELFGILLRSPYQKPVRILAESCYSLSKFSTNQLDLFTNNIKKEALNQALDGINEKYGEYVITPALMLNTKDYVPDRIAFGGVLS